VTANGVTGGDPTKVSTTGGTVTGTLDLAAASNPLQIPHGAQAGYVWTDTDGSGNGAWQPSPGGTPATTVQAGTSYGTASAVGTLGSFAREDHQHGTPGLTSVAPATTLGIGTAAAAGTATLPARADHVHPTAAAGVPGSSAVGDVAATGSASTFAASDHKHGRESFGAVAGQTVYGAASANGVAATLARSDHTHGTPSLTTTAPATTLGIGTAAALGTATLPALADHVHPMAAAGAPAASAVGDAGVTGVAVTFAASDHKHAREAFGAPGNSAVGDASAAGVAVSIARSDHTHGRESFGPAPATTLGIGQAAVAGTAATPARSDHAHPLAAAGAPASSAVGDTGVTGVAVTFAASDHKHARESFGTPGASAVGDAAGAGVATSVARSDHTHGREAFGNVTALAAFGTASSNGTAATVAHSDHVHGAPSLPTGNTSTAGIVQIDNTAADYQPLGPAAPGSIGKVADAGHVHPMQPHIFPVSAYGAKGDGQLDNTGSMTSGSGALTLTNAKFAAGDVGKLIAVKGAKSTGDTSLVGTITAFTSSTQVTVSVNATATVTGAQVMWATDDTSAIQSAIAAANSYAVTHNLAEIYFPLPAGLFYGVGGALKNSDGTNSVFNSQLTVPVNSEQNNGVTLVFRGAGDSGQTRYWNSDYPVWSGSAIQSFGVFTTALNQSNNIAAGGNPSVLGGPTGKFNYGVLQGANTTPTYSNTALVLQDITILTTHSASGWTYSAVNAFGVARFHARNFCYGTNGVVQFYKNSPGLGDYSTVSTLSGGLSIGVLMPSNGNNASNYLQNVVCNGGYTYALYATEHTVGNDVTLLYSWSGLCPVGNYSDSASGGAVSALHAMYFDQICVESCTYHLNIIGTGQSATGPIIHAVLDTEGTVQFRDAQSAGANTGAGLAAALGEIRLVGSPSTITIQTGTGAGGLGTGLRIIKEQNLPGVPSSGIPALVDGTAVCNTLWRPATVYLSGGTNVTTVAVSRLAGGVNTVAVSNVISQAAGPIPANTPVRLGPGQWIKVTTSAGTLPTAVWVLD